MAQERTYSAVPPVLLTANGTTEGVLQVVDTAGFYIQMQSTLFNNLGQTLTVYIKKVVSPTVLWVGPTKGGLDHNVDLSAFTVAAASTIQAAEQNKQTVPNEARLLAVYENDPVDAVRAISVDSYGNHYTSENPLPVAFDGTVEIGDVSIVQGGNTMTVNPDGSTNTHITKSIGLFDLPYDSIQVTYVSSVQENYQSYLGGLGVTPVQLIVVTYTDATKNFISSVSRTPTGP
jgi:hypothetical protein